MRRRQFWLYLLSMCLVVGCSKSVLSSPKPNAEENTTAKYEMPEEMKMYLNNPNVQWMAGMWVTLENSELLNPNSPDNFEIYSILDEMICATITVQNGLEKLQEFDLMIFADGIQVEFTIDGNSYKTYSLIVSPQQSSVKLEFPASFALNMGRLDFVLSFDERPQGSSHLVTHSIWIAQEGEAILPTRLVKTIDQRNGLKGRYSGTYYASWLWNEGIIPAETDNIGPRSINIKDGETVLLEAIAANPGLYRTILVVDGTAIDFVLDGNQSSYIDWESNGTNMLQLPITMMGAWPSGSIYTITTPLTTDDRSQFLAASWKVELLADSEE